MKFLSFIFFLLVCISNFYSQDFQGVATYKSHRKVDLKMGDDKMSDDMQEQIQEQLRKQFQQEYTLKFNGHESIYKKEEKLDAPNPMASSGIMITISDNFGVTYKNIKENRFTEKTEILGKIFLIKDTLISPKWELKEETKNIGDYTCFKAVNTKDVTTKTIDETGEVSTVTKPITTTVWYTPQIPINNGPADYQGLPGLILEINDGDLTLVCTKIVLNPQEEISITEPDKGKVVSRTEFSEISEKKSQEQMERFRSNHRDRKDGERVIISIGG